MTTYKWRDVGARLLGLGMLLALILDVHLSAVRPWYLNWGSTPDERLVALPGDGIVSSADFQQTRAITIDAPAESVWPWLAQTGQDRGGFYSFDVLENAVGCRMPTTDVLRPDRQQWAVGDKLWMYPEERGGGIGFVTLRDYVPGRALAFGGPLIRKSSDDPDDGSWSMLIQPLDSQTSRLLIRGRGIREPYSTQAAFAKTLFDPMHYVMERRMMLGLKALAETGSRQRVINHVHVALWVVTAVLGLVAAIGVLFRQRVGRPVVALVLAATTFQILTLAQPPIGIGLALVTLTALPMMTFRRRRVLAPGLLA